MDRQGERRADPLEVELVVKARGLVLRADEIAAPPFARQPPHRQSALRARGNVTVNVAPSQGALSTPIVPPWASTSSRVMKSPSPRPLSAAVCAPRSNR